MHILYIHNYHTPHCRETARCKSPTGGLPGEGPHCLATGRAFSAAGADSRNVGYVGFIHSTQTPTRVRNLIFRGSSTAAEFVPADALPRRPPARPASTGIAGRRLSPSSATSFRPSAQESPGGKDPRAPGGGGQGGHDVGLRHSFYKLSVSSDTFLRG